MRSLSTTPHSVLNGNGPALHQKLCLRSQNVPRALCYSSAHGRRIPRPADGRMTMELFKPSKNDGALAWAGLRLIPVTLVLAFVFQVVL